MPLFRDRFGGPRRPLAPPIEEKASLARRLFALTTARRPQWTPRDYAALAREGFAKNPVAYRCVRMDQPRPLDAHHGLRWPTLHGKPEIAASGPDPSAPRLHGRLRIGGDRCSADSWEAEEVPLGEERESYRCEILTSDASAVLRGWDADAPAVVYAAADLAADFPAGSPASLTIRLRQRSAIFGLGSPLQQTLWL